MKILFMASRDWTNPYAAGGDIHSSQFAIHMAKNNHQITYLCTSYPGCKSRETLENVDIIRIGHPLLFVFKAFYFYLTKFRNKVDLVYAEVSGGSKIPLFSPIYVREPLIVIWFQVNRKIFLYQYPRPVALLLIVLEILLAKLHRNAIIVTPSEDSRQDFIRYMKISPDRIFVTHPGIPEDWVQDDTVIPNKQQLVVWLGKIRRYKCPHHVILAMQNVCQQFPGSKLVIAGRREDVKFEREMSDLSKKLGIAQNVDIRVNLTEEEKRILLNNAKVFVLPSPIEGFGIVILEANACGTPAVVSDGIPFDAVQDGYNGIRVPFGNIEKLTLAITKLFEDEKLFSTLAENGRKFVQDFTWSKLCLDFEKICDDVCRKK